MLYVPQMAFTAISVRVTVIMYPALLQQLAAQDNTSICGNADRKYKHWWVQEGWLFFSESK